MSTPVVHCADNKGDRALGEFWEQCFGALALAHGKAVTAFQIGRDPECGSAVYAVGTPSQVKKIKRYTLPDVVVWDAPVEHHEIKHKNPTPNGLYGLEVYRFNALINFAILSQQNVYYTIHDHRGNRNSKQNRAEDWVTADVRYLADRWDYTRDTPTYIGGECRVAPCHYWDARLWTPLVRLWGGF